MTIKVGSRSFDDVEQLEKLVRHAATQYDKEKYAEDYNGLEITDPEYDELFSTLKNLKPESTAFHGTSPSDFQGLGATVKHDPPMTSIDKADETKKSTRQSTYQNWLNSCAKILGRRVEELDVVQSYKRDGVALRVNYINGKLESAGLRPRDGVNGTDVTRHMINIKGVPQNLRLPLTLSLNGEIECWNEDFLAINQKQDSEGQDPYKNPRNYTAGCLGRDDPSEVKDARLRIAFYSITGFEEWESYYKTEIERAVWANSPDGLNLQDENRKGYFVQVKPHLFKHLMMMEDHAKKLPYYTDGIILKINAIADQEELGHTGDDPVNPPRYALAWKFLEEIVNAEVKELEWNATRTGRVVPTAIFVKSVRLADTDVSRATVNNYGWVSKMGIGPGTIVELKKAGKIIPNVCGVVSGSIHTVVAPKVCPACSSKLEIRVSDGGNTDLLCTNPDCGAKQINGWIFYLTKMGSKGLGTAAMEKILATGKVKTLPDLYDLKMEDLVDNGFTERQAVLALATIYGLVPEKDSQKLLEKIEAARLVKKEIEAWKFFASLGIPGAGETVGKTLVAHYKDFAKIRSATVDELTLISGIGQTTATAICGWFKYYAEIVDRLLLRVELLLPKTGSLNGINFCLTGSFSLGKKHWQSKIENLGGNVQGSVGKTTSYLVQENGKNDGSPSEKEQKAIKLGVPIISVKDLEELLNK